MALHAFAWLLLGLVAAAETGLLGYLVNTFEPTGYPAGQGSDGSPNQMRVLILLLLFAGSWTTLFSLIFLCIITDNEMGCLSSVGTSLIWLIITIAIWAVATTLFHQTRIGGDCTGSPTVSVCRQLEAVEALGWAALGLCVLCLFGALYDWHYRRNYYSRRRYYY